MAQPRGLKRHADDSLPNEQRLSKRFNLLSLGTHIYNCSPTSITYLAP